jgi:large subunit ribosomal protein L13
MLPMMKCYQAKPNDVKRNWHVIDGNNQVVGRLAVKIARILMGKTKPEYTAHIDVGDFVVVTNCEKVRLTGRKMDQKVYQHFTGYPGGRKIRPVREILAKKPEMVLREAVRRMMPKNILAGHQMTKLKIYAGPNHPHQAQMPTELKPDATW